MALILIHGYLLDTAFVPTPLGEWLQAHHKELFLPSIAVAEMAQGIGKLRRAGGTERAVGQGPDACRPFAQPYAEPVVKPCFAIA